MPPKVRVNCSIFPFGTVGVCRASELISNFAPKVIQKQSFKKNTFHDEEGNHAGGVPPRRRVLAGTERTYARQLPGIGAPQQQGTCPKQGEDGQGEVGQKSRPHQLPAQGVAHGRLPALRRRNIPAQQEPAKRDKQPRHLRCHPVRAAASRHCAADSDQPSRPCAAHSGHDHGISAERLSSGARRQCLGQEHYRRFPHRHAQHYRGHDIAHAAPLYGRQDQSLRKHYEIPGTACRRPAPQRRAQRSARRGQGLLAGSFARQ